MAQTTPKTVLESLAQDIAAVLKSMGGSAHQNLVVDCVAALKRQRGEAVNTPDLRQKIIETFEQYRRRLRLNHKAEGAPLAERAFVLSPDRVDQKRRM